MGSICPVESLEYISPTAYANESFTIAMSENTEAVAPRVSNENDQLCEDVSVPAGGGGVLSSLQAWKNTSSNARDGNTSK
jgi:hypothetical protein